MVEQKYDNYSTGHDISQQLTVNSQQSTVNS
jgi:hypothetical protein